MTTTWTAESKQRPKISFTGKGQGTHKDVLRQVKEKLVGFTKTGKAKLGEPFKVTLSSGGAVVDAWILKAKPTRSTSPRTTAKKKAVKRKVVAKKKTRR